MVIVTDSRQPGMLHVEDVLQAGESSHHKQLQDLQSKLSFDDPINIQFTSVTLREPLSGALQASDDSMVDSCDPGVARNKTTSNLGRAVRRMSTCKCTYSMDIGQVVYMPDSWKPIKCLGLVHPGLVWYIPGMHR